MSWRTFSIRLTLRHMAVIGRPGRMPVSEHLLWPKTSNMCCRKGMPPERSQHRRSKRDFLLSHLPPHAHFTGDRWPTWITGRGDYLHAPQPYPMLNRCVKTGNKRSVSETPFSIAVSDRWLSQLSRSFNKALISDLLLDAYSINR